MYCLGSCLPAFLTQVRIVSALQFHFRARSVGETWSSQHSVTIWARCSEVSSFVVSPVLGLGRGQGLEGLLK